MQKILSVEIVKTRCAHLFDENELIKNRFDHQNKKYFWVRVVVDHGVYWVPAWRKYFKVNLGVYLQSYPFDVAELIKKLFRKMWWVSKISVSHLINPVPGLVYSNNFIIQLPLTQDIYDSFLSKKLLSNIRYGYKNLVDKYEVSFCSCQDIPVEYVEQYLNWKSLSHDFAYSKPAKQFLSDY